MKNRTINKVLVANRGEIAIRIFRACTELNIRTVAIYSAEDSGSYHRYKADEAYLVGKGKKPIDAYLDIEGIIEIAKANDVDAIHPGYGFLSENAEFCKRCDEEGIIFIGPKMEHLITFGDKAKARDAAVTAGIPVVPGSDGPIQSIEEAQAFAEAYGFPIMIKAVLGGGGRGMRIVRSKQGLKDAYERAKSEAKATFGQDDIYVEKYLESPRHIEVQIIADSHGHTLHLLERDCSVQRRHQKVVEIAPSRHLSDKLREGMHEAAVKLMANVNYLNAGTVEFLVTPDEQFYFIEVNPRVQVEHTITELITGVDIVQTQILIAEGHDLFEAPLSLPKQEAVRANGYAIQCRVTTEDPANQFMPDTGKIMAYRTGGGFGVRLDAGNGYQGAVITPHYDSLLVKVSTWALTFEAAAAKMVRNLKEFRIRGIKTNIAFLENVVTHPSFVEGSVDTTFIDATPELFVFPESQNRGTKMLTYIANTTINGFPGIKKTKKPAFDTPKVPEVKLSHPIPDGTKQILEREGAEGLVKWIKEQKDVLLTDTTFRDAHQSLLATRMRTHDLLKISDSVSRLLPDAFSLEMWGGATFDTAYRFLKEDPWERLALLREKIPNVLFQMLLRGANAVGYTNYPDNLIKAFVKESAAAGIDVFRIFDSLNWIKGMTLAIDAVRETGRIAEAAICYTGDILSKTRTKYDLAYYKNMAKELEKAGAHIIAIKDMAGLLKPEAAYALVSELKAAVNLPIHLHMHDTSGNGVASYIKAVEAGVDIVDTAVASMSGMTSQPSANTLYYGLEGNKRPLRSNIDALDAFSNYWESVRSYYEPFESGLKAPNSEVYKYEMPGGQYSNLQQQAAGVGLAERWEEVKEMYARVNQMFGDIVKVTPSSKVVGDMALFMVQNDLTEDDIYEKGESIDFPDSVISFFQGTLGQPYQGFPKELQRIILKGRKPITDRPGERLEPVDFDELKATLEERFGKSPSKQDILAYALYPKVFTEYQQIVEQYGKVSVLDTPTFFYGLRLGEEVSIEIEQGKTLIVKLVSVGQPQKDGTRTVYFELNGQPREVIIQDKTIEVTGTVRRKADKQNPSEIGASMPGTVIKLLVEKGEKVKKGDHLIITEAMKMETTLQAPFDGVIEDIFVKENEAIQTGDLLLELRNI
ncbi:pyruvate carboxylase [Pullulanibacillus camelliae]|uniref:Pyruvate carboxylase n=1 Tax=Pullulanibacillus camelliae TaxID=1707096 RepID=A0A8J2VZ45_9BACL|nr:pyruvate carboxylase [Pullulanibacillus camelliae]GGE41048.1 pyruvate carboxylase [Pullulanibacillus camelliae]